MRDWLLDSFRYDLWANRRWAPLVMGDLSEVARDDSPDAPADPKARAAAVFAHIVWAHRIWLSRLEVPIQAEGSAWLPALNEGWLKVVEERDLDGVIAYRNTRGVPFERPLVDILTHVLFHGSYHRGQLREIAATLGLRHPETDYNVWRTEIEG